MKRLIFLLLALLLITGPANAETASAVMGIEARIVNLVQMPLAEAVQFCISRNIECPEIMRKAEAAQRDENGEIIETYRWISVPDGKWIDD